jgi:hypothetical protein
MTYPVANPQTKTWFDNLNDDVVNLQSYCLNVQTATAGGGAANAVDVLNVATSALRLQADIATVSASSLLVSALVTMFNSQPGWSAVNVAGEFTTLNTLAGNIVTAIVGASAEYPHDAANPPHLLDRTWSNNQIVNVTLTAAQMPHTMTAIAAYIAEVPAASQIVV